MKLNIKIKNFFKKLEKDPNWLFIIKIIALIFLIKILLIPVTLFLSVTLKYVTPSGWIFPSNLVINLNNNLRWIKFSLFYALVFVPIFQTFLAQKIPNKIMRDKNKKQIIMVSAIIFALLHFPVISSFPSTFLIGLLLAYAYNLKLDNKSGNAFWIVVAIHSLHNLTSVLLDNIF